MFVAVILGNVVAALFAFLGVGQVICYLSAEARPAGAAAFMFGLSVAAWPLAVAVVIYLLVQVACWLEKLYFAGSTDSSAPKVTGEALSRVPAAARHSKKEEEESPEAPVFFKATAPPPPPPATVAPPIYEEEMDVKSAAAFAAAMDSARHAESEEHKIVTPVDDDWDNETPPVPEKPKSGLSFFKID